MLLSPDHTASVVDKSRFCYPTEENSSIPGNLNLADMGQFIAGITTSKIFNLLKLGTRRVAEFPSTGILNFLDAGGTTCVNHDQKNLQKAGSFGMHAPLTRHAELAIKCWQHVLHSSWFVMSP
jgi:hypothetical protein